MTNLSKFSLEGKVAIVTGGSAGIGRGIALALGEAGANVAVVARGPERVEQVCEELRAMGREALALSADVTSADQVNALVQKTQQTFGHIDILVNNAGGSFGATFKTGPIVDASEESFHGTFDANVLSTFLCTKAVVPGMRAQGSGVILNVASVGGRSLRPPTRGMGFYSASKAALISLSHTLSLELAPEIRVNCLNPGMIDTPRVTASRSAADTEAGVRAIALGRQGVPEDIGGAAVFLASDAAAWITGIDLDIHGGLKTPSA